MARIVDTEADSKDDIDAGDDVDGDAPEVEEANEVDEGEEDGGEDEDAEAEAAEEKEGDDQDSEQGEPQVPPELASNDLVRLPGGVDLDEAEGGGEAGLGDDLLHPPLGRDVFLRSVKQEVSEPLLRRLR